MRKFKILMPILVLFLAASAVVTVTIFATRNSESLEPKSTSQNPGQDDANYGKKITTLANADIYLFTFDNGNTFFFSLTTANDGSKVLRGNSEPPFQLGKTNDTFIDLATKRFYKKISSGWVSVGMISDNNDKTPYVGSNGNWFVGEKDTGVKISGFGYQSAYELYIETHPTYDKPEDVWLSELIKGELDTRITFLVKFDSNGGTNIDQQIVSQGEKLKKPNDPTKSGYQFDGWLFNGDLWNFNNTPVLSSMTLVASWSITKNNFDVKFDSSLGDVDITKGSGYTGEEMVVVAKPKSSAIFRGWYKDDIKVSDSLSYSFSMPAGDYEISARFSTLIEYETWKYDHGYYPIISDDEKIVTYGIYPQTHIEDNELISKLNLVKPDTETNFVEYGDDLYFMKQSKPSGSHPVFNDGTEIIPGQKYWFKVEPIEWNVISQNATNCMLSSKFVLQPHRVNVSYSGEIDGIYSSNYERSEIRTFLNDDFYKLAFSTGDSFVNETIVDNSDSSTMIPGNSFVCGNTTDRVFMPSRLDLNEHNSYELVGRPTDYARSIGSFISESGATYYWTRSPVSEKTLRGVGYDGIFTEGFVDYPMFGIRPWINIKID